MATLGKGCAYIGMIMIGCFTLLVFIGWMQPEYKCGEIGYRAKLSMVCREALGTADSDKYCDAAEMRDIECARPTAEAQRTQDAVDFYRKIHERY